MITKIKFTLLSSAVPRTKEITRENKTFRRQEVDLSVWGCRSLSLYDFLMMIYLFLYAWLCAHACRVFAHSGVQKQCKRSIKLGEMYQA